MTIYLKTLITFEYELKFLLLNIEESMPYVDKILLCEPNRTHTGAKREYIFEKIKSKIPSNYLKKIKYVKGDISHLTTFSETNGRIIHNNEKIIRGFFTRYVNLNKNDIIFSVDTDEIIYRHVYPDLIKKLSKFSFFGRAYKLNLRQFFYKVNYLWLNKDFIGPTACTANYYLFHPAQWRYHGKLYPGYAGCHFSWCMSVPEMIKKLKVYSHAQDYGHFAKKSILDKAISEKTYPFDTKVDFKIKVIPFNKSEDIYPKSIFKLKKYFQGLIYEK